MMITIFTPTYNRADKLHRVYESLVSQSNHDFEWLVIDDGSSDNTESVVKKFDQSLFDIIYYKQENGGKHTAHNRALGLAHGEYFFCLDSDDWLAVGAIEKIKKYVSGNRKKIILAYKKDKNGRLLSDKFPVNIEQINTFDLNNRYHCRGEFTVIFSTDFARKYLFPIFEKERFLTESVLYDRMAMCENAFLMPEIITICEYQENGLSSNLNHIMKNNPAGYCLYFMQRIDLEQSLIKRIITSGKYKCFCCLAKEKKTRYTGKHQRLVALCSPIGYAFLMYYKLFRSF